jgi:hypothetical protein
MGGRKIRDMNLVSDRGAIGGVVVMPKAANASICPCNAIRARGIKLVSGLPLAN